MKVTKRFTFEAAHFLPGHSKCGFVHGHTYTLEVTIERRLDWIDNRGMVMDFGELEKIVQREVIQWLDHSLLNNTIEFPTCEKILLWIWYHLTNHLNTDKIRLSELKLWEGLNNYATFTVPRRDIKK